MANKLVFTSKPIPEYVMCFNASEIHTLKHEPKGTMALTEQLGHLSFHHTSEEHQNSKKIYLLDWQRTRAILLPSSDTP